MSPMTLYDALLLEHWLSTQTRARQHVLVLRRRERAARARHVATARPAAL